MSIESLDVASTKCLGKLLQLHDPPSIINTVGTSLDKLLDGNSISIVGSRKVTSYGRSVTADLSRSCASKGVVVVSGLALGVDSIAHRAALEVNGKTIAVLPSGIEKIYPASHIGLARDIVRKNGALVSEYGGKEPPMRHQFIERNRIIAALGDALLITEAAENSGSLHTARFALELGKPVLAVPGNINSATSKGTNNLIKMGATPVTSVQDIFEAIGLNASIASQSNEIYGDNDQETKILLSFSEGVVSGADLLAQTKLPVEAFQQHLTMLEIKGRIKPCGNDTWSLN
jgi:DNA processing protein